MSIKRYTWFLLCPFCGLNRKLDKTQFYAKARGREDKLTVVKGRSRFDIVDPATAPLIDCRHAPGGRGAGFPRVTEKCITLEQAKGMPEYAGLVTQIREQCERVLSVLKT